jgi:hypothetical protein
MAETTNPEREYAKALFAIWSIMHATGVKEAPTPKEKITRIACVLHSLSEKDFDAVMFEAKKRISEGKRCDPWEA